MARKKLIQFDANQNADNILQAGKPLFEHIKGNWHKDFFKNKNPIIVELACGRGEYTTGLAKVFPEKNFVGVDIKGNRIWTGSQIATKNNLTNVAFLRTQIQSLENYFAQGEIAEIWLTFPDPRPKGRDEHRRLTHERFLNMYRRLLQKDGFFNFKTDNAELFAYSLAEILRYPLSYFTYTHHLYNSPLNELHYGISTNYEQKFVLKGHIVQYFKAIF
jgi:tRNA (guanine-N7-)-methyltransferase